MPRINEASVRSLAIGKCIYDEEVSGLHVRVNAKSYSWFLSFVDVLGNSRRVKLGEWPYIGLVEARELATDIRQKEANIDKRKYKKGLPKAIQRLQDERIARVRDRLTSGTLNPTLTEVWDAWRTSTDLDGEIREHRRHFKNDRSLWNVHICPRFGDTRISSIHNSDIEILRTPYADNMCLFNRIHSLMSILMKFAITNMNAKYVTADLSKVKRFKEEKRVRYATREELSTIYGLLGTLFPQEPDNALFIYTLLYTGARCGELISLRWENIISNLSCATLHTTKNGEPRVLIFPRPLAERYQDYLNIVSVTKDRLPTDFVFRRVPNRFWKDLCTQGQIYNLRLHDLRHTFATYAIEGGAQLAQLGKVLGHKSPSSTARYAHLTFKLNQETVDTTAKILEQFDTKLYSES